ncbi:hypothetical protein [Vibrio sp. WXL103]|uniref:hypothetical protein n=1 Tax=Vibrio sp. WXL103 TaxID=3450710 RepID=UPI003EC69E0B
MTESHFKLQETQISWSSSDCNHMIYGINGFLTGEVDSEEEARLMLAQQALAEHQTIEDLPRSKLTLLFSVERDESSALRMNWFNNESAIQANQALAETHGKPLSGIELVHLDSRSGVIKQDALPESSLGVFYTITDELIDYSPRPENPESDIGLRRGPGDHQPKVVASYPADDTAFAN